jgi:hypothetical protein
VISIVLVVLRQIPRRALWQHFTKERGHVQARPLTERRLLAAVRDDGEKP